MENKIPYYDVLNMLLTGLVFLGGCVMIFPKEALRILGHDVIVNLSAGPEIIVTVCAFAAAYEIGFIINRIGSVILEELLIKYKMIPYDPDYTKYNKKKKEYPILNILSRERALSRSGVVLFCILCGVAFKQGRNTYACIFLLTTIVLYLSYKKHSKRIVELISKE